MPPSWRSAKFPKTAALLAAGLIFWLGETAGEARADRADGERIERLARAAVHANDEKARLAATANLGRIDDARVLRPLFRALRDDSATVRAVAAAALGELGYTAALPRLHQAEDDESDLVRERARDAIEKLEVRASARRRAAEILVRRAPSVGAMADASHHGRSSALPRLYIVVQSVSDRSQGGESAEAQRRSRLVRTALERALAADPDITVEHDAASELGLSPHGLDVSIVDLERRQRGDHVEVSCELRVAVSDERGRMMSFVQGRARVEIPRSSFEPSDLPEHQREAMVSAAQSLREDVAAFLAREVAAQ